MHTVTPPDDQPADHYPYNTIDNIDLDPRYEQVRRSGVLQRVRLPHGEGAWLATRYSDVRTVLSDKRFSRAAAVGRDEPRLREQRPLAGLISLDPPVHTRLRVLVSQAFTTRRLESLRPTVADIAGDLATELRTTGSPADLVDEFALPLPVRVICEFLAVPTDDRARFRALVESALIPASLTDQQLLGIHTELFAYVRDLVDSKRRSPGDDLVSALIAARDEGQALSEDELVGLCLEILAAGHEPMIMQIPNFVLSLTSTPSAWQGLVDEPARVPGAVEELMRMVPLGLGGSFARYALEDVRVGNTDVRAGDAVVVSIAAANRDPERFDAPEVFDPTREGQSHMGFGHGAHHCLGAALARIELQEALLALTSTFPALAVADVEWRTDMVIRGPRHLLVRW